jgi:PAS domain S-box-containing protein
MTHEQPQPPAPLHPASDEWYRTILEMSADGMFIINSDRRYIEVNQRGCDMLAYTREEILRRSQFDLIPPEDLASFPLFLDDLNTGQTLLRKRRMLCGDGRFLPVEINARKLTDGCFLESMREITGRKQIEMELGTLAKFPDENPNPVLRVAKEGTLLYANRASAGLLADWDCSIGQRVPDIWHHHILDVLASGLPVEEETAVGERVFTLFFAPVVEAEYVNVYGYDITVRKRVEEQLVYKAQLLANIHDAVVGTNEKLTVTYWNKAAEDMFGWTEEEALGRETAQLFKTQIPNSSRETALQQLMTLGHYEGEVSYIRREGGTIQAHARSTVLRNAGGEYSGLVTTIRDITEQKRAEEALRLSEEQFAKAFYSSPVAIVISRLEDGQLVDVNQAWCHLLGYTREQAVGHTPMDLNIIVAEAHQQTVELLINAGQIQNWETSIVTRAGEIRDILFSMELLDLHGESHILTIFTDITERKQMQRQELELTLEKERVQMLTSFVQDAAHEFKTPLTIINTTAFVMARLPEMEKRQSKADIIETQIYRITKLVDMLLLMAHVESRVLAEHSAVDISMLVETVCQQAVTHYGQHPALHIEMETGVPFTVKGDPDTLAEAFWQVMDNAFRFTPADGAITVSVKAVNEQIHLVIRDTGFGISLEDLPRIFKTFWRQDKAHTLSGFGLGLPIAQKIVDQQGGRIEVASKVGVGTTVSIILPLWQQPPDTG